MGAESKAPAALCMLLPTFVDIALRPAAPGDAPCIALLGMRVFLDTYAPQGLRPLIADEALQHFSTEAIARLLARADTGFILAESAGHLIGFAQLTRDAKPPHNEFADGVELARLYVLERFTRRGVGACLLREAEGWAASGGAAGSAPLPWLTAWVGHRRALAFYAAQGYADAGRTRYDFQGELHENRVFVKAMAPR